MRLVLSLLVLLSLQACSILDKFGNKDNVEPPAELVSFQASIQPKTLWSMDTGHGSGKQLLGLEIGQAAGKLFTVDSRGRLMATDLFSGKLLWTTESGIRASAGPGSSDTLVVIGGLDGEVIAFDSATGKEQWRTRISSEVLASPAVSQNIVVVRSQDGRVFGLNSENGLRAWVYDSAVPVLSLRGNSAPVNRAGTTLLGFDSGLLVALRTEDGRLLWEERIASPAGKTELDRIVDIDGKMAVVATEIYAVSYHGKVVAMDIASGNALWSRDLSSVSGLAVDRTHLYVSADNGSLHCLDRTNGETLWVQDALANRQLSAPAGYYDQVVVGDLEGYLHWLDADTGTFTARMQPDKSAIRSAPLLANGRLYVLSSSGKLSALEL